MRLLPLLVFFAFPYVALAQSREPAIIPRPVSLTVGEGAFTLTQSTIIWGDSASGELARQLADYLEPATGFRFTVTSGEMPASGIRLMRDESLERLGNEGYTLVATPSFRMTLLTWKLTVRSLTFIKTAISVEDLPRATQVRVSTSRSVNANSAGSPLGL